MRSEPAKAPRLALLVAGVRAGKALIATLVVASEPCEKMLNLGFGGVRSFGQKCLSILRPKNRGQRSVVKNLDVAGLSSFEREAFRLRWSRRIAGHLRPNE